MKKIFFLLLVLLVSIGNAKIWRVDGNTANKPDFTNLQDAINGASAGDTLYIAGYGTNYGNITINKQLVLIGPGYFIEQNLDKGLNPFEAQINNIVFQSGAENSKVISCSVGAIQIESNNIIIKRNRITNSISGNTGISGIMIKQNFISTNLYNYYVIGLSGNNIVINNNIIVGNTSLNIGTNGLIKNNVMDFSPGSFSTVIVGMIFENNILISGSFSGSNNIIRNNIGYNTQADSSLLFTLTGNEDAKYILKNGSPAKGAGVNGIDAGIFGGDEPYVLSGIPPIPTIYEATVSSTATNKDGLSVKIKAKTNK